MSAFEIREFKASKGLPSHWDILIKGQDDSIATVWVDLPFAEELVKFLDEYPERRALEERLKNNKTL